ncbi:MAG: DUF983 domain-containing protein [Pseudomonadota bacterium]
MAGSPAPEETQGQPGLLQAALFGLCPHCRARTLFEAPAMIAGECRACGLPLAQLERGGRLVGLITIAVGGLLVLAALSLDAALRPPLWMHVVLWAPLTVGAVLGVLRLYKVVGVYSAYEKRRSARDPEEPK